MIYVSELASTAIKGFGLFHPARLRIDPDAIVGDRLFYLLDADGNMAGANYDGSLFQWWTQFDTETEILAIGVGADVLFRGPVHEGASVTTEFFPGRQQTGSLVEGGWSEIITELAGIPLRLVRARGGLGGQDVEPVSLVSVSSVESVGTEGNGRPLDHARFRMNAALTGAPAFAEESWVGKQLVIGEVTLRVVGRSGRCAMVQRRTGDGGHEVPVLRMLSQTRGVRPRGSGQSLDMGVYARIEQAGILRVGDTVEVRS